MRGAWNPLFDLFTSSDIINENTFAPTNRGITPHNATNLNNMLGIEQTEEVIPLLKEALENTEKKILSKALKKYKNSRNIGQALGISHTAVLKKLKKYQL